MLITSQRHTASDLVLWREQEDADLFHYERGGVRTHKAVAAMAWIKGFLAVGPAYCAVSWGKDSVALADLVIREEPATPLVWVRVEPILNPDCEAVRDRFLASNLRVDYHEITVHCRRDAAGIHASGTLEDGFREAVRRFGERRFSGIRGSESATREQSMKTHGMATKVSCRPILDWSAADVYAYLAGRNLPVHPAYAMNGGGRWDRQRIRVASLGGKRGDGMGRREWEKEYYSDVLRRLEVA